MSPPNRKGGPFGTALTVAQSQSSTAWYLILHPPRHVWVKCCECRFSAINELNMLRRNGWQESAVVPRRYRCGECAESMS